MSIYYVSETMLSISTLVIATLVASTIIIPAVAFYGIASPVLPSSLPILCLQQEQPLYNVILPYPLATADWFKDEHLIPNRPVIPYPENFECGTMSSQTLSEWLMLLSYKNLKPLHPCFPSCTLNSRESRDCREKKEWHQCQEIGSDRQWRHVYRSLVLPPVGRL